MFNKRRRSKTCALTNDSSVEKISYRFHVLRWFILGLGDKLWWSSPSAVHSKAYE